MCPYFRICQTAINGIKSITHADTTVHLIYVKYRGKMQGKNRVIELRLLKQLCTCKHTGTHRGPFLNVVSDAKVRTFMVGRAIESGKGK